MFRLLGIMLAFSPSGCLTASAQVSNESAKPRGYFAAEVGTKLIYRNMRGTETFDTTMIVEFKE